MFLLASDWQLFEPLTLHFSMATVALWITFVRIENKKCEVIKMLLEKISKDFRVLRSRVQNGGRSLLFTTLMIFFFNFKYWRKKFLRVLSIHSRTSHTRDYSQLHRKSLAQSQLVTVGWLQWHTPIDNISMYFIWLALYVWVILRICNYL